MDLGPARGLKSLKRLLKVFLSLSLLVALIYALQSVETMRISTTYPAPSGVYKKIITTAQTILARDGGSVVIGKVPSPVKKLEVDGGASFGGNVNMQDNKITNAADPTNAQDAATKNYVDKAASSSKLPAIRYQCYCGAAQFGNILSPIDLEGQECVIPGGWDRYYCAPLFQMPRRLCWCESKSGRKCGYFNIEYDQTRPLEGDPCPWQCRGKLDAEPISTSLVQCVKPDVLYHDWPK